MAADGQPAVWALDVPQDATFHELFEETARRFAGRPAVTYGDETLSFDALNRRANRWARRILAETGPGETPVVLHLERSLAAVVAMLAVVKTGGYFVPVDTAWPAGRLDDILQQLGGRAVLISEHLDAHPQARLITLDGLAQDAEALDEANLPPTDPGGLAYMLFTSGSTGAPKGVMIEHRGLVNHAYARQHTAYARSTRPLLRLAMSTSMAFDGTPARLCALVMGHHIFPVPQDVRADPFLYLDFLEAHELNVVDVGPSFLRILFEAGLGERPPPHLEIGLVGGEEIDQRLWEQLAASPIRFFNTYGPSECSITSTEAPIVAGDASNIGVPLPNIEVLILDENLEPTPAGERGEICLAGVCVGRGYHQLPEIQALKFTHLRDGRRIFRTGDGGSLDPSGRIVFHGRLDRQVKVRGFRIELGEIENALLRNPEIRHAAVIVRPGAIPGEGIITAFVAPHGGARLDLESLRAPLVRQLPPYMVPQTFVRMADLPMSHAGKIDRRKLEGFDPAALPDAILA